MVLPTQRPVVGGFCIQPNRHLLGRCNTGSPPFPPDPLSEGVYPSLLPPLPPLHPICWGQGFRANLSTLVHNMTASEATAQTPQAAGTWLPAPPHPWQWCRVARVAGPPHSLLPVCSLPQLIPKFRVGPKGRTHNGLRGISATCVSSVLLSPPPLPDQGAQSAKERDCVVAPRWVLRGEWRILTPRR